MRSYFILLSLFIFNLEAENLSVDKLVQKTLENNPELNLYEQEIKITKEEKAASTLLTNPEIEATGGQKTEGSGEGGVWGIEITQALEYPGRYRLREAIANGRVNKAEIGLQHFKSTLTAKAKASAYKLLYSQQLASATREIAKQGEALIKVLEGREPAGTVPLLEMRIIEANIISLQKKAHDAEQSVQSTELDLKQLSGDSLTNDLKLIQSELNLKNLPSVEVLVNQAMETNFSLKEQEENLSAARLSVELAKNERRPGYRVGSFFSEENAEGTQRIGGVKVSIPLNIWNRNENAINSAEIREEQTKTTILTSKREVERIVRENYLSYQRKLAEIKRWRPKIMTELKAASQLADESFRLGAIPAATYVALQTEYIESLQAILSLKLEALENLYQLDIYGAQGLSRNQEKK